VVQRFPEKQWIDQGLATPIVLVQLVNAIAFDQKAHDAVTIFFKPYFCQPAAIAQKERSTENVRGLHSASHKKITSFLFPASSGIFDLIFPGRYDRKKAVPGGLIPLGLFPRPSTATRQSYQVDGFFSAEKFPSRNLSRRL
jgi:hypothetical protein